jgi:hypothetical protein
MKNRAWPSRSRGVGLRRRRTWASTAHRSKKKTKPINSGNRAEALAVVRVNLGA